MLLWKVKIYRSRSCIVSLAASHWDGILEQLFVTVKLRHYSWTIVCYNQTETVFLNSCLLQSNWDSILEQLFVTVKLRWYSWTVVCYSQTETVFLNSCLLQSNWDSILEQLFVTVKLRWYIRTNCTFNLRQYSCTVVCYSQIETVFFNGLYSQTETVLLNKLFSQTNGIREHLFVTVKLRRYS